MKVLDPGHYYELANLDGTTPDRYLQFVKREGPKYPGNVGTSPGTTVQDVLRCIIDRLEYVNKQIPHKDTVAALEDIKEAIWHLECRAADRHWRPKPKPEDAVYGECCSKCNHVGCKGECRWEFSVI